MSDPVTAFFLLTLLIGVALVGAILRRPPRTPRVPFEPPSHVNVNPIRPSYVGIDHHSPFCASADGTELHCECGLSDREVPA